MDNSIKSPFSFGLKGGPKGSVPFLSQRDAEGEEGGRAEPQKSLSSRLIFAVKPNAHDP